VLDITVQAPEDAGIAAISSIKAELVAAMDKAGKGSSIVLDISRTKRADSSLAQLIISFKAEAAAKGLTGAIKGDDEDRSMRSMLCCDGGGESCAVVRRIGTKTPEAKK